MEAVALGLKMGTLSVGAICGDCGTRCVGNGVLPLELSLERPQCIREGF